MAIRVPAGMFVYSHRPFEQAAFAQGDSLQSAVDVHCMGGELVVPELLVPPLPPAAPVLEAPPVELEPPAAPVPPPPVLSGTFLNCTRASQPRLSAMKRRPTVSSEVRNAAPMGQSQPFRLQQLPTPLQLPIWPVEDLMQLWPLAAFTSVHLDEPLPSPPHCGTLQLLGVGSEHLSS